MKVGTVQRIQVKKSFNLQQKSLTEVTLKLKSKMSSISENLILIIITIQIHFSFSKQLNSFQNGVKNNLISSTEQLDPKMRIQLADYLKSVIGAAPLVPQLIINQINEVLDEYKSESSSGGVKKTDSNSQTPSLMDVEYIYGNTFANKVQQSLSQEELNRFMKSINEDEPSSKMSSARYLTIYLEKELKNVAEKFTQQFEKVTNQLTTETIDQMNKR